MTWVRYDDNVANHPKVAPLDDATYRLWREAIEWCAHNLTDGVILTRQLGLTSTRASTARARRLVEHGLWHRVGEACDSKVCPPAGANGWVIHDYWDYQFTRVKVQEEQEAKRERQRRYMEKVRAARRSPSDDASQDAPAAASSDASSDANPAPPRPAPKGSGAGDPPRADAARRSAADAAGGVRAENRRDGHPPPDASNGTPDWRELPPVTAPRTQAQATRAQRGAAAARAAIRTPTPARRPPGDALDQLRALTTPPATAGPPTQESP